MAKNGRGCAIAGHGGNEREPPDRRERGGLPSPARGIWRYGSRATDAAAGARECGTERHAFRRARIDIDQRRRHLDGIRPHTRLGRTPPAPESLVPESLVPMDRRPMMH